MGWCWALSSALQIIIRKSSLTSSCRQITVWHGGSPASWHASACALARRAASRDVFECMPLPMAISRNLCSTPNNLQGVGAWSRSQVMTKGHGFYLIPGLLISPNKTPASRQHRKICWSGIGPARFGSWWRPWATAPSFPGTVLASTVGLEKSSWHCPHTTVFPHLERRHFDSYQMKTCYNNSSYFIYLSYDYDWTMTMFKFNLCLWISWPWKRCLETSALTTSATNNKTAHFSQASQRCQRVL